MSATLNELTNNPAERIKSMLSALRGSPKLLLVICGAAALSVIIALMFWAKEPDYRVLFSNISDEEGGAIVAQLTQLNIPYRIDTPGGVIMVPGSQVHEVRMKLAQQGLPKGGSVGFELLDQEKFGISQFEEFVKNYNSYLSTVASATKYTAPDRDSQSTAPATTNGALFSDGSLRRLTSQLKATVGGNYPDADAVIQSLGSIGITVKFDGKIGDERGGNLGELSIDTKKLDAALKDNPKAVEALFLGKDGKEGIKDRMEGIFDTYLGDKDAITKKEGVIETALESLREQDKRIGKQITAMERRIEEAMARKEKEFQRLDKVISDMNNMSSQLQGSLAGLI